MVVLYLSLLLPNARKEENIVLLPYLPVLKSSMVRQKKKAAWFDKTPTNDYVF
jgi:hypothetical protein